MAIMRSLLKELTKCAKCGACRAVCPVFQILQDETMVSRGRISVLETLLDPKIQTIPPQLKLTNRVRTILDCCLMCLRCREKCPSGVKTDIVFQTGRALFNLNRVRAWPSLLVFRLIIPIRPLYNIALKLLYLFQRLFRNPTQQTPALRHLSFSLVGFNRLPDLAPRSVLEITKRRMETKHNNETDHPKVVFFVGCLINYVYPKIFKSLDLVFKQAGIELIIPRGQLCCGLPLLISGDRIGAKRLAQRNIAALEPDMFDWIITACTSCGRMFKEEYQSLVNIPNAKTLSQKVIDITEFVVKQFPKNIPLRPGVTRTTYHAPCHASWNETNQSTRSFLKRISRYVETDPDNKCCGGGGSFSFKYTSLAHQTGTAKLESLHAQQIDILATGCPGCIMQLNYLLDTSDNKIKVRHPIEILADNISGIPRA